MGFLIVSFSIHRALEIVSCGDESPNYRALSIQLRQSYYSLTSISFTLHVNFRLFHFRFDKPSISTYNLIAILNQGEDPLDVAAWV